MDKKIEQFAVWRLINHPDEIQEASEIINENDFTIPLYKNAFRTILRLKKENRLIDLPGLYLEMGKPDNISKIIEDVDDCLFGADHYARLLKQRNLESQIQEGAKEREYDEVQRRISELKQLGKPTDVMTITGIIEKGEEKNEIFRTGYTDLDSIVDFASTDLFILAGRPSVGKSLLGACILANMAKEFPVGLISFEMSEVKIVKRLFQTYSIDYINSINQNFNISCPTAFNLNETRKSIREMKLKKGVKVVAVDYLQLMSEIKKYQSRHLEISDIIRQLKQMAKEFDVAMMVVSSLSRAIDQKAEDAKPTLGTLKESGDIEYAADIVCFLHRLPKLMDAELIVAKNRNGKQGIISLVWRPEKIAYGNHAWVEDRYTA
jgi:replicative DNA helicase